MLRGPVIDIYHIYGPAPTWKGKGLVMLVQFLGSNGIASYVINFTLAFTFYLGGWGRTSYWSIHIPKVELKS